MVVNRDKEFLYGRSKACLRVWTEAQPDYEGHLAQQARDLGVCVRTYACRSHLVNAKLEALKIIAGCIGFLPVDRKFKGNMAQAVIFGRGLYGVEVDPATQQQAAALRRLMATAICRDRTVRSRQVMLLLMESGKWEPEVAIAKRMMNVWRKLVARGLWTAEIHE